MTPLPTPTVLSFGYPLLSFFLNDSSVSPWRYKALLELLKHVENHSINTTRIKNLYDIWSKKIGSMKTWPVESRYAVHLEFMVFCLLRGHAEDAYHLALCLEQEKGDIGPMLKMMMGLTFYELWYSSIPKEFQSERYNSVESHMADSQSRRDSDASVMNGGLDLWLLPLRFSDEHSFEDFVYSQRNQPNHHYKNAVKYLQLALRSEPSASAALLPLIQLLLMGGHVDEALNMLEKQCCNSASVLPIRARAALLEHFDGNNSLLLRSCFEDMLKKDPTCSDALAKLIKMHQNGDYSLESLLEMIALHLDATDAEYNTWRVFSSCFLRLSSYEDEHKQHCALNKTPKLFTDGISGKSWRLRCRWWLTRHFSNRKLESEIEAGDLQLLTYKAACASYMYGWEYSYVTKAYSHLEKENGNELLLFLDEYRGNSFGIYQKFQKKFTHFNIRI
ncbi:hypothetical protein GLYMA_13G009900v4 [Glycine max]|nr:hypothetical protein GLYMA_13G009900v4 [Glycine max]KAH1099468.1 hypothetical protein GYH30_034894 [Glycine max]